MKKIEATLEPFKLEEVRDALVDLGVDGMSVVEVKTLEPQAHSNWYRGTEYVIWFTAQVKIEVVVPDAQVAGCVERIERAVRTGANGCEIVVLPIDDAIRIRTGEALADEAPRSRPHLTLHPAARPL